MRSPRDRSAICAIEVIRLPVRFVSWLSSSRAMVSTCWPTLRTSCATTAKPAPCAPARELSISAFSASIFIWLVIFWIDLVFSQATWLTSAVNLAISVETSASSSALAEFAGLFCNRCGSRTVKRGGHWRKFLSLCAVADLLRIDGTQREHVGYPLSRIMANDWFNFRCPAGSITGTSCILFVQVAFVGIGSKLAWPRLCRPGRSDSRAAAPRHRPGLRLPTRRLCPYLSKAS